MNILNELITYNHAGLEEIIPFELGGVIEKESVAAYSRENFRVCLACMDYTSLEVTDTAETLTAKIVALREKLKKNALPEVAAVCVYPRFAAVTRQQLAGSAIRTTVVGGGFPAAGTFLEVKQHECRRAIEAGAEEVDVVLPAGEVLGKNYQRAYEELLGLREACAGAILKVIIETGELKEIAAIFNATLICAYAGADFVKSSTGKVAVSATPEAVYVMCEALRQFHARAGRQVGIKVAGGITKPENAISYMSIARHKLGQEWIAPDRFRIGASRLLDELIKGCKL
ncbi:MAG: deoxyribose-phosphate aldolase [Odoribacteraceae bacterium]|jgi:deoxyribose-phosphate aldolase|nr:deoxyribose-phosphate aldolase [Odoribacteraceae bacterium]